MQLVEVRPAGDRLPVVDLRFVHLVVDVLLALQAFGVDLDVQLAHALDDGLAGLGVDLDVEGGVLAGELVDGLGEDLALLDVELERHAHDGFGHVHRVHADLGLAVGDGLARGAVDAERAEDVPGLDVAHVLHFVRVHPDQPRQLLLLARGRLDRVVFFQRALLCLDVGQLAIFVGLEFECQSYEGCRAVLCF